MSKAHHTALLQAGFKSLDIDDNSEKLQQYLLKYIHELEMFNAAFNLVKVENTEELIIKHIFDSLAPWKFFAEEIDRHCDDRPFYCADIGSGAGFPGIPLACLFLLRNPSVEFTLIERMDKRCAVLENVRAILGLTNTAILHAEAEKAPADYFDLAVFRAFRPLDSAILNTVFKCIRPHGLIAAYKGKTAAIKEEMAAINDAVSTYRIISLSVPFYEAERNLVIFGK